MSFLETIDPQDVRTGDAKKAAEDLGQARKYWSRARKSELLEETFRKGSEAASGGDAGVRNAFARLANNKKAMRGFTQQEQEAIRAVAKGSAISNNT